MKILVTGARGFVGQQLLSKLRLSGQNVIPVCRSLPDKVESSLFQNAIVADFSEGHNWLPALAGVDVIVHCAARVHQMGDRGYDALDQYRKVNVDGTLALARQAAEAGVKRFIFLSSIKVNGESTTDGVAFTERDKPAPEDAYGQSKMEAEHALKVLSAETSMELVIIRPVLVYGDNVKGNFAALQRLIAKGVPLPLGLINNRRSLVSISNLTNFIERCIIDPRASGQVFLISDGDDVSTKTLACRIGRGLNKPARLLPVPALLLRLAAKVVGKSGTVNRLLGDLQVDISHARNVLNWTPVETMSAALNRNIVAAPHEEQE